MQTCPQEPRIVKVIESCRRPDHLKNCMSWVEDLKARGSLPPTAAARLCWLVSMKLDDTPAIQ